MSYKSSSMPQRSSPFRRPASPSSPTPFSNRASTPPSARAAASPMSSPSKLKQSYTVSEEEEEENTIVTPTKSSSTVGARLQMRAQTEPPASPSPSSARRLPQPPIHQEQIQPVTSAYSTAKNTPRQAAMSSKSTNVMNSSSDSLTKIPPALLHTLRDSFSVLDTGSSGNITPASVHETLGSLGLGTSDILPQLFPAGRSQTLSLPQYLTSLCDILVAMSPPQELLNAFSAFDDDDSGQIDVAELRRALIETPPEAGERPLSESDIDKALDGYTGRRILGRSAVGIVGVKGIGGAGTPGVNRKGGDVFRYHEFVGNLSGTGQQQSQTSMVAGR